MIIKCPNCGGSVIYDAASGTMKCTVCQHEYDSAAWSALEKGAQAEAKQEQELHTKSDTSNISNASNTPDTPNASNAPNMPDTTKKKAGGGFRLATDSASTGDGSTQWTDTLRRKETKSFEAAGIGDEELKKEERIIQYIDLNLYKCTSCGAQLMLNGTEASTFCSFCGLPTIIFDRISKEERPDKILPFKLTKEQALSNIQSSIGQSKFAANEIKELSVEDIRGIYMPYWLYDSYIRMHASLYTTGKHHHTYYRDASCTYKNIPADAALGLNNILSERLAPFDMKELVDFDASYLSGFYADKYDVPADAVQKSIRSKAQDMINTAVHQACPGTLTDKSKTTEEYHVQKIHYALLPAYFVTLRYGDSVHLILVNGQTGKVVTNLPANRAKMIRNLIINTVISCVSFSLVDILLLGLGGGVALSMPLGVLFFIVIAGVSSRKQYKEDLYNLNAKSMTTYVHDRN